MAATMLVLLAGCTTAKPSAAPSARPSPTIPAWATTPAVVPSGERGAEWHRVNRGQPWEGHVLTVDTIGRLLLIQTDIPTSDTATAIEVCRAGHAYVNSIGAPDAAVSVYGNGRSKLAESRNGAACQVAL